MTFLTQALALMVGARQPPVTVQVSTYYHFLCSSPIDLCMRLQNEKRLVAVKEEMEYHLPHLTDGAPSLP